MDDVLKEKQAWCGKFHPDKARQELFLSKKTPLSGDLDIKAYHEGQNGPLGRSVLAIR